MNFDDSYFKTFIKTNVVGEKGPGYDFRDQEEADWAAQGTYSSVIII